MMTNQLTLLIFLSLLAVSLTAWDNTMGKLTHTCSKDGVKLSFKSSPGTSVSMYTDAPNPECSKYFPIGEKPEFTLKFSTCSKKFTVVIEEHSSGPIEIPTYGAQIDCGK